MQKQYIKNFNQFLNESSIDLFKTNQYSDYFELLEDLKQSGNLNEGLFSWIKGISDKIKKNLKGLKLEDLTPEQKIYFGLNNLEKAANRIYVTDPSVLVEPLKEIRNLVKGNAKLKKDKDFVKFADEYYKKNIEKKIGLPMKFDSITIPQATIFQGIPIINAYYMFPNIFTGERFGMIFSNNILVFFQEAADALFEKFLKYLKIIFEHEMTHRSQYIQRRKVKKVQNLYDIFRGILNDPNFQKYYRQDFEIEAHAQTTVRLLQDAGYTKEDILKLVDNQLANPNSANILAFNAYGFKDLNIYFSKKGAIWTEYVKYVKKYVNEFYK